MLRYLHNHPYYIVHYFSFIGWAHQPGLTHLILVHSPGCSGTVCTWSIANSTLLNSPIVDLLILFYFILFSNVS